MYVHRCNFNFHRVFLSVSATINKMCYFGYLYIVALTYQHKITIRTQRVMGDKALAIFSRLEAREPFFVRPPGAAAVCGLHFRRLVVTTRAGGGVSGRIWRQQGVCGDVSGAADAAVFCRQRRRCRRPRTWC